MKGLVIPVVAILVFLVMAQASAAGNRGNHGKPTPTPTTIVTATKTPSSVPTGTSTSTPAASATATPTRTAVASATGTPTSTVTRVPTATSTQTSAGVPRYGVFESTYSYTTTNLTDPFSQVTVSATFLAPSGKKLTVHGFYYDTNTFKVRFTPAEIGAYTYTGIISGPNGTQSIAGGLNSVASNNHGFIRRVALPGGGYDPHKLQFDDGSFAPLVGMNDCWDAKFQYVFIGSNTDPGSEPSGEYGNVANPDTYFAKYGDGEGLYNVFRWQPGNCSFSISPTSGSGLVDLANAKAGDTLLSAAKTHGFHIYFTLPNNGFSDAAHIQYIMARWGAYVDLWGVANEADPDLTQLQTEAPTIRSLDPYQRLVTSSLPQSGDTTILDLQEPHIYGNPVMNAYDPLYTYAPPTNLRARNMPIFIGEFGNGQNSPCTIGVGVERVASWAGVFGNNAVVFWNGASSYPNCTNMYLGYKERQWNKSLVTFFQRFNTNPTSTLIQAPSNNIPGIYELSTQNAVAAYIFWNSINDSSSSTHTTTFTISIPFASGTAQWLDPATLSPVGSPFSISQGSHTLTTPAYRSDLVLSVR